MKLYYRKGRHLKSSIPKIIHYCWFGGAAYPPLVERCIESWKRQLPDYSFWRWDESNFDITSHRFVKEAYEAKKWAFVSDYVRFYVLERYGGIYLDTDVEVIKSFDPFLHHGAFVGYESRYVLSTAVIGSQAHHPFTKAMKSLYDKPFIRDNGIMETVPNTQIVTQLLESSFGLDKTKSKQLLQNDIEVYPQEYFSPKSYYDKTLIESEKTVAVHHFDGSWHTKWLRYKRMLHQVFIAFFGKSVHEYLLGKKHGA